MSTRFVPVEVTMSFVRIARRLLTGHPSFAAAAARRRARLTATQLDDRINPVLSLVDASSVTNGAGNGSSTLLGLSRNGQVAIFSSTSTNFFPDQIDVPGSEDLFCVDLRTGEVQMVTALPGTNTSFSTLLGPGKTFGDAVISGDGKFVAFSTRLNAAQLDPTYQFIGSDLGNSTFDVFRWTVQETANNVNVTELVSRTYEYGNGGLKIPSVAVGATTDAISPAISFDGNSVAFVSTINAAEVLPQRNNIVGKTTIGGGFNLLAQDNNVSNDIFVTNLLIQDTGGFFNAATTKLRTRVLSQYGGAVDFPSITINNAGNPVGGFQSGLFFRTIGSASGTEAVQVDTQGRYLSDDGTVVAFVSGFNPTNLDNPISLVTFAPPSVNRDAYRAAGPAGKTDTAVDLISRTVAGGSLAASGGTADVAIVVPQDSTSVVFTASVGGAQLAPNGAASAGVQELYFRRVTESAKLLSSVSGNFSTPATGGMLQTLAVGATAGRVDGFGFSITPDGRFATFASTGKASSFVPANSKLGQSAVADPGVNTFDVFIKDVSNGRTTVTSVLPSGKATGGSSALNPRISADGRFVSFESDNREAAYVTGIQDKNMLPDAFVRDTLRNVTQLLDRTPTGVVTGNKGIVPRRTFPASDGVTPPRAVFTSASTNLIPALELAPGASAVFNEDLLPADAPPISNAQTVGAVSAGNGQVAFLTFAGNGTPLGNRVTPFPGFTGELRVATYTVTITDADGNSRTTTNMIVGAGPGGIGPRVAIIDGEQGKVVRTFLAYEPSFNGGVYVAAANNADGSPVLALGAGEGGGARLKLLTLNPNSTALDPLNDFITTADFFSFEPSFRGGVRPALGDFGSLSTGDSSTSVGVPTPVPDGVVDLVAAAGEGGGPRVSIFDGARLRGSIPPAAGFTDPTVVAAAAVRLADLFVFENRLRNGAFVAAGDFDSDGRVDLVAGAGPGGGPRVTVFDGRTVITTPVQPNVLVNFFAFDPESSRAGVRVAVKNIDNDFSGDILAGSGAGTIPEVRTFAGGRLDVGLRPTLLDNFIPFNDTSVLSGAWVG